jgi:dTDP-4-amino-4,6-dideoxygalactose transaminase
VTQRFNKSFTQQEPLPEEAIAAAVEVMRSGELHRYGGSSPETGAAARLEQQFAQYLDLPYCLACASGGYALAIALRSAGVRPGDRVLCNSFTLAPVPGAVHSVGALPVWVDTTPELTIDLEHLQRCAEDTGAAFLLLSCMRGHIPDMERLLQVCNERGICLIEDCAHTMGAAWKGRKSGTFGSVACFSTQTYKHINSGEGGLLVTADPAMMARAVLYSGSYMLFERHTAAPEPSVFEPFLMTTPNQSGRMDNLRAAVLLPQLERLDDNIQRWNRRYQILEQRLRQSAEVNLAPRPTEESYVGSSIQFRLPQWSGDAIGALVEACRDRGVELKWFGAPLPHGYTSRRDHWLFFGAEDPVVDAGTHPEVPGNGEILATLLDMRSPLTFSEADCECLASILLEEIRRGGPGAGGGRDR